MYFYIFETTKTIIFETRTEQDLCYLSDYIDVERDEPHKQHRLGTVSNTITRGLKPVLWDPNPRLRSWCGSYTCKLCLTMLDNNANAILDM